ncbi:MAG: hypothetical protein E5X48_06685 [Mesorhizobium sp.]|uniref:hypothetical protein n=1 Tax=Mesorhizobium sp. TaxID=1871066 RepID=UPI0011FA60B0|nr:hypothetical protein [Mesorhizobium sp.]TIQ37059.1 MAG: hypothetical protein E5X48_06685 [Mesorhizobium sp.]
MNFSALSAMEFNKHIRMAQRHVRDGERQLTRQRNLIARLRTKSLPTIDALEFLGLLEELHAMQRQRLSQLIWQSASWQLDEPLTWEMPWAERLNDWISIPDRIFRLAFELQEKLKGRDSRCSMVEATESKRP